MSCVAGPSLASPGSKLEIAEPERNSTRKGGIPSGSLEVRRLENSKSENRDSANGALAVDGDHADFRGITVAAIDHLLAHHHRTCVVLGAGSRILGRQRGKGADRAEWDDEKAECRFQHCSHSSFRRF